MDTYYDTFTPVVERPPVVQQQQPPQQQPVFSQTTYNPTIPIPSNDDYEYESEFEYKKYITMFILILIIYFIFSLDAVKNQIGLLFTCINVKEDGTISKWGYLTYGLILSIIIVGLNILIDNFITIKFN